MTGPNGRTLPVLDGWLTAEQAAKVLGVSRQTTARIFQRRDFRTIHTVGDRPLYVVRIEEVERLLTLYERISTSDHVHYKGTPRELVHSHGGSEAWEEAVEELWTQPASRIGGKQWVTELAPA